MLPEDSPEVTQLVRARLRRMIADLDYRRTLVTVSRAGASQRDIARGLSISQPAVQGALARAADVDMPVEGFCGATPLEICQRYAAGLISREQLVSELGAFPYTPAPRDAYDDVSPDPAGAWSELYLAEGLGLIELDVYGEVFARSREQTPPS